jgi:uncharacterized membrane protein YkvA (DUF1232 family)
MAMSENEGGTMSEKRTPTVYNDNIFSSMVRQVRLAWRLFLDPRVSWMSKALPIISALYVISPVDFLPGAVAPVLGSMDDLAIAVFGLKLFIEFSPQEIVAEHLRQLTGQQGEWDVVAGEGQGGAETGRATDEVVEGEYTVVEEEK